MESNQSDMNAYVASNTQPEVRTSLLPSPTSSSALFKIHAMEAPSVTRRPPVTKKSASQLAVPPMSFTRLSINEQTPSASTSLSQRRLSSSQMPMATLITVLPSLPSPSSSSSQLPKIVETPRASGSKAAIVIAEAVNEIEEDQVVSEDESWPREIDRVSPMGNKPSLQSFQSPRPTSYPPKASPRENIAPPSKASSRENMVLPPLLNPSPFAESQQPPQAAAKRRMAPLGLAAARSKDSFTFQTASTNSTPRSRNRELSYQGDDPVEIMISGARARTVVFADARSEPLVTVLDTPYHLAQLQLQLKILEEEERRQEAAKKMGKRWKESTDKKKSKDGSSPSSSASKLPMQQEPTRLLRKASSDLERHLLRTGSNNRGYELTALPQVQQQQQQPKRTSRQKRIMDGRTMMLREPEPETSFRSEPLALRTQQSGGRTSSWWRGGGGRDNSGYDVDGCF